MTNQNNFTSKVKQPWTTYDNELIQQKGIFKNPYQKLCYMYLVSFANCSKIFPSMDSIAEAICGSKRTAMRTVQELESMGLIEVERKQGLSNQYTLNDYFEVMVATSDRESLVTESHQTSDRESLPPVTESHHKTKRLKIKTKNKTSSSSDSRNSIDSELKQKYPSVPFDEVKEELLNDDTATINTGKQYKSMLEYRLKNWKPKQPNKRKGKAKVTRTEMLPDWFKEDEDQSVTEQPKKLSQEEIEQSKKQIEEKLKLLRG